MTNDAWIAEQQVVWVFPDGARREGRIAIGVPWVVPDGDGEARCACVLAGLEDAREPISGDGVLEALVLAVRFVGWRLHVLLSQGGRVIRPGWDEEDYDRRFKDLFGPLLCEPPGPLE